MVSVSASSRRLSHSRTQIFRFLRLGGPSSCWTSKYPSCRRKRNATMRFCDSSSAILVGVWPRFRLNASQNATKTRPKRDQNATKTRPKRDQNATKTRPKRDQNARCNIANASWVSRFGMLEARVLLAFRVISLAFSQNANPTHSVIRA